MSNLGVREMVIGTEGKPSYLMVANPEGLALGVKVVVVPLKTELFIGLRIRLCNQENTDTIVDVKEVVKSTSLCGYQWGKLNSKRASAVIGASFPPLPFTEKNIAALITALKEHEYVETLVADLSKNFDVSHPQDDIVCFVEEGIKSELDTIRLAIAGAMQNVGVSMVGNDTVH